MYKPTLMKSAELKEKLVRLADLAILKSDSSTQMTWFSEALTDLYDPSVEEASKRRSPRRTYLKVGYEQEYIFVDDRGFSYWEHHIIDSIGKPHWYTCSKLVTGKCPLCEINAPLKQVTQFTVLEVGGWVHESGTRFKNSLLLFVASRDVAAALAKIKYKNQGTLVGLRVKALKRNLGVSTSRDFEIIERVDLSDFNDPKPFDYEELFRPLTTEELTQIASRQIVSGTK